jgi:hypothetical protein
MTQQMKQNHVDAWQGLFEPEPHCKPNEVKLRHKIFSKFIHPAALFLKQT